MKKNIVTLIIFIMLNVKKLFEIENDKFIVKNTENSHNECIVLSMVGPARVGKSTFINCFLSRITNENITIINTSDKATHCTLGVDYVMCNFVYGEKNIELIIFDCQGLVYEDSKYDDKLLSFIYSISNIVVYHDTNIINNQTLHSLTSLCIVANNINECIKKPILYFRIKDYYTDENPNEIIEKTFTMRDDQYDKVRGAIKKLFPTIKTITTEPLGKIQLSLLKNKQYLKICENTDFNLSIDILIHDIVSINDKNNVINIFEHAKHVIDSINNNTNISFRNYDYYTLLIDKNFDDFWTDNVEKHLYDTVVPSIYECEYELCITKLQQIDNIVTLFKNTFENVDESLLLNQLNKYYEILQKPLLTSKETCLKMAEEEINSHNQTYYDRILHMSHHHMENEIIIQCFKNEIDPLINKHAFEKLMNVYCSDYYERIYKEFEIINEENIKITENVKKQCLLIEQMLFENINEYISNINDFTKNNSELLNDYCKIVNIELLKYINHNFIRIEMNNITKTNIYKIELTYNNIDKSITTQMEKYVDEIIISSCESKKEEIHNLFLKNFITKYTNKSIYIETIKYQIDYTFVTLMITYGYNNNLLKIFNDLKNEFGIKTGYFYEAGDHVTCNFLLDHYEQFIEKLCDYIEISYTKFNKLIMFDEKNKFLIMTYNTNIFAKTIIDQIIFKYMK